MRDTSIEVYNQIKAEGLLERLQWIVYNTVYEHGPITQGEAWSEYNKNFLSNTISPIFAKLKRRGVIVEVGKRPCRLTGRTVYIWQTTNSLPLEDKQGIRKKKELQAVIEERQACAAIAFDTRDIVGASIGHKIMERGTLKE